jgi:hypothetical protein
LTNISNNDGICVRKSLILKSLTWKIGHIL